MKGRLSDNTVMPMTVINPPAVQEMNADERKESTTIENNGDHKHDDDLEIEPL
jgi:hypothetical protein